MDTRLFEIGLPPAAGAKHRRNAPRGVARHQCPCFALAQVVVIQPDQRQRCVGFILNMRQYQLCPRLAAGPDLLVSQTLLGKGHGPVEQLIQRSDQLGRGAVVGGQAVLPRGFAAGF